MPLYEFQHPETKEIVGVVQKMKDKHVFVGEDGVKWDRVFSVPNASIDSDINAFSESDFLKATAKKGMTAGDMMDLSEQLSKKRENSRGLDPVKQKTVTKYEMKTGKAHPNKSGNKPKTL